MMSDIKTQQEKEEWLEQMNKANMRAEVILTNLLAEGELSTHEVLNALATALILAAHNCEAPKESFFSTLDKAWDEIGQHFEPIDSKTIH
jgi:hypothetical protein